MSCFYDLLGGTRAALSLIISHHWVKDPSEYSTFCSVKYELFQSVSWSASLSLGYLGWEPGSHTVLSDGSSPASGSFLTCMCLSLNRWQGPSQDSQVLSGQLSLPVSDLKTVASLISLEYKVYLFNSGSLMGSSWILLHHGLEIFSK